MASFILFVASAAVTVALNSTAPAPVYGPQPEKTPPAAIPATEDGKPVPATVPPGTVRPASYDSHQPMREPEGRGFTCVDKKCKTVSPVYNSGTPIRRERGRLAAG